MKSSRFQITLAQPDDNKDICRLFRIPFAGEISLAMEREPDYFVGARIQYEQPETYICRERSNNRIAACFSVGRRNVFLNGRKTLLRYHSDLRIDPDYQKSSVLFDICFYFKEHIFLPEGFSQTIVFADNQIMNALIDFKRHKRLHSTIPFYVAHSKYVTHTIALKRMTFKNPSYVVRRACEEDISTMQEFFDREARLKQFYPCYDFAKISTEYYCSLPLENYFLVFEKGQLVGLAGIWDQKDFKQTRVVQYSSRLSFLKPFLNILSSTYGGFLLPDEGAKLNALILHSIVVKNNSAEIFKHLYEAIHQYSQKQNFKYMICGLDEQDALNKVFKGYTKREVRGTHYLVSYDEDCLAKINKGISYIEVARI